MKEFLKKILPFLSMGRVIYRVPWVKEVFLTFDDGPNPDFTPAILDILKKYSVSATFFLLGQNAKAYPDLVEKIVNQGHSVANHTLSHSDLSLCKIGKIIQEIQQCRKLVPDNYILRPPYGNINVFSMLLAITLRYKLVFWSIDSFDHKKIPFEQVVNNVMQEQPRPGDVILLHDMNENVVQALPLIIEAFRAKGLHYFGKF